MKFHAAPWSNGLVVLSLLATGICAGVGFLLASREGPGGPLGLWLMAGIVAGALLFTVRGYWVSGNTLCIRRLLWSTRLPLAGLVSATADPEAMRDSIRVAGNGGFFSYSGRYMSDRLGSFRAFVTDPARAVVLRYADRIVMVSPASPEEFVRDVEAACGN